VDLQLLSVDEGITGYRDDSLEVMNDVTQFVTVIISSSWCRTWRIM